MPKAAARPTPSVHAGGRPARPAIRGDFLQGKREAAKLSRERCAALIRAAGEHASGQSLYQWERGQCRPDGPVLLAWCAVLKINAAEALVPQE